MSEKVKKLIKSLFYETVPLDESVPPDNGTVNTGLPERPGRTPGKTQVRPERPPVRPETTSRSPERRPVIEESPTVPIPPQPEKRQKERRKWFGGSGGKKSGGTYVAPTNTRDAAPPPANGGRRNRSYPDASDVFPGHNSGGRQRSSYDIDDFADPVRSPSALNPRVKNMQGGDVGMGPPIREYIPKKMEDKAAGKKMHYGEYKRVIDDFAAGNIVILNLQNLDTGADEEKNKVLCLIFGAVAAVDGYIYMISDNIYLFAMGGVDVSGALRQGRVGEYMPGL